MVPTLALRPQDGPRRASTITASPLSRTRWPSARQEIVDVAIRVRPTAPSADLNAAEHVVEADIGFPGGDAAVYGPADDPGNEQHVRLPAGSYRARVSYLLSGPPQAG